jgi:hypothetical protein
VLGASLERLLAYIEREEYRGYDPYDALNSPLLRWLTLGQRTGQIAVTQLLKRSPVNVRPWLGIPKGHNPKGLGLFLWGYAKLYAATQEDRYVTRIDRLLRLLDALKSTPGAQYCSPADTRVPRHGWGYNFDWRSRAFFVPKFTPTIVNSSFIGHALLDTYLYTGRQLALDLALPIEGFLLQDLQRTAEGETFCFSYTPQDRLVVHNANLLGASLLIRLHRYTGNPSARQAALESLAYSMNHQREDGSWWYAETDYQRWIDSFHTGFNLQSIKVFLDEGCGAQYADSFQRGVHFYTTRFFLPDGTARYYHDRTYPLDIHVFAQAVVLLWRLGDDYRDLADRVLLSMVRLFQGPAGFFYFQRRPHLTITIPYMRWAQAWAMHAETEAILSLRKRGRTPEDSQRVISGRPALSA